MVVEDWIIYIYENEKLELKVERLRRRINLRQWNEFVCCDVSCGKMFFARASIKVVFKRALQSFLLFSFLVNSAPFDLTELFTSHNSWSRMEHESQTLWFFRYVGKYFHGNSTFSLYIFIHNPSKSWFCDIWYFLFRPREILVSSELKSLKIGVSVEMMMRKMQKMMSKFKKAPHGGSSNFDLVNCHKIIIMSDVYLRTVWAQNNLNIIFSPSKFQHSRPLSPARAEVYKEIWNSANVPTFTRWLDVTIIDFSLYRSGA